MNVMKVHSFLVSLLVVMLLAAPAYAQIGAVSSDDCETLGLSCSGSGDSATSLLDTIRGIINIALSFAGVIALAVLVWGGISYILSLGEEAKVGKAKKMILYAIVGLLIIGLSAIIVNVVINFF